MLTSSYTIKLWPARVLFAALVTWHGSLPAAVNHEMLQTSANLTYEQVFASAMANAPEAIAADAREQQVVQYGRLADSWFPGQPVLETGYIDDGALDAVGLREIEARLRLTLWRPGERQQSENLARNLADLYQTWEANLELEVAGRLRSVLWALERAETLLALEREALAVAQQFADLTNAQFTAGSAAESDLLRARSLVLSQQQAVFNAEAELVDAERGYSVVTGLTIRPAQAFREQRSAADEISISHPLLRFLQANAEVARSRVSQVKRQAGQNPSVSIGMRRERGSARQDYIDTVGIGFTVPLGRGATVTSQVSDARREQADMQVALQRGRIMLDQQFHEAEHQLYTTELNLDLTANQAALNEQQWEMTSLAYELGEVDAVSVALSLRELIEARKARARTQLRYQQLVSDYNQTLGQLP